MKLKPKPKRVDPDVFGDAYIYDLGGAEGWRVAVATLDVEGFHSADAARRIAADIVKAADEAERRNKAFTPP